MSQNIAFYVVGLPEPPVDAARAFHHEQMATVRSLLVTATAETAREPEQMPSVTIVFEPAGHAHQAWRLAAIQGLAREAAPVRVNGIVGDDEPAINETLAYLADAAGITGQLLSLENG